MKAHVIGGSGYTGGELLRILIGHPSVDELSATSVTYVGKPISSVHPNLEGFLDSKFLPHDADVQDADFVFLGLPHGLSMKVVPGLYDAGIKVIDLSADYRIADKSLYEKYYVPHENPELLEKAVYGLPELFRKDIKGARLCANPGCYVTAAILALAPLAKFGKSADLGHIIVDAMSGTSGAGVSNKKELSFSEVFGNPTPYKVCGHRHEPEMNHILQRLDKHMKISFTPSLSPTVRGIISKAHIFGDFDGKELIALFDKRYKKERFVRMVGYAAPGDVLRTNICNISVHFDDTRAVIASAIDNLVKGAAGQAVQNMNLMAGKDEATGLETVPYHP